LRKIDLAKKEDYNVTKNLIYSGISTVTSFFLFILLVFVGRYLGVEEYGIFTFGLAFVTIFEMFTDFGLRDISVRNVARDKALTEKYIGNLLVWKLLLCTVVYIILIATINILHYDSKTKIVVYILALSSFLKSFKYTYRLFFQVHNRFDLDALLVFIERASYLIIGLLVLALWKHLIAFVICFTSVRLLDFLITLAVLRRKIGAIKPRLDFSFVKQLQIEAVPLGMFYFVLVILSYIDTVMLSMMESYREVGLYNAAFKIYEGIAILPTVLFLVVLPRLSELFATNREHHRRLAVNAVKYMFVTATPILVYGILFSHFLISRFFGFAFVEATRALQILFVGIVFQFSNWMLNTTLISIDKQRVILVVGTVGLVSNVILNLILIPRFSYEGAAFATVLGECLMFVGATYYLHKRYMKIPFFNTAVKPIIAAVPIVVIFRTVEFIPVLLLILLTGGIYVGALFLLQTFDRQELKGFSQNVASMFGKRLPFSLLSKGEDTI